MFTTLKDEQASARPPLPTILRAGTRSPMYPMPVNELGPMSNRGNRAIRKSG